MAAKNITRSTRVLIPVLGAGLGRWGVRSLSTLEVLLCKDVSVQDAALLEANADKVFLESLIPGKCLVAGFKVLFNEGGIGLINGQSEQVCKGGKMENAPEKPLDLEDGESDLQDFTNFMAKSAPAHTLVDENKLCNNNHKRLKITTLDSVETMGQEDNLGFKSCTDIFMEDPVVSDLAEDLEWITREQRERSAVKSDNAAVPEYLWFEHLFETSEKEWTVEKRSNLITLAPTLQGLMKQRWTSHVRKTFNVFLLEKYPKFAQVAKEIADPIAQRNKISMEGEWKWAQGGKEVYKLWWRERLRFCEADLAPGIDAIQRATRATWWS